MEDDLDTLLIVLYNLTILGTTVYLVSEKDWSPWWFVLSVLLLTSRTRIKE
jgi:hypothetical protein